MNWFRENVSENPMMAEVGRFGSLLRGKGMSAIGLRAILAMAVVIAGFLMLGVVNSRGGFPPAAVLYTQLVVCGLAIAFRYYGVIAGERERRSWELLRVAPVTDTQVVMGKFAGMAMMIFWVHVIFAVPLFFSLVSDDPNRFSARPNGWDVYDPGLMFLPRVLGAELYSLVVCGFMAALTLFFSARVKRAFGALALSIGTYFVLFILLPLFTGSLARENMLAHFLSPFPTLTHWGMKSQVFYSYAGIETPGTRDTLSLLSLGMYFGLTLFMITYAAKTLAFADNNVRFVPRKKQDARG